MTNARRGLVTALLLCPATMVVDPVVAAATTRPYSARDGTISDLAVRSCDADLCSPWWPVMTVALLASGAAMIVSAVLLRRSALRHVGVSALVALAGAGTVGVALVPVDVAARAHYLLAAPIFPAQSVALLLLAGPARVCGPGWRPALLAAGVVSALASVALVLPLGVPFGVAERLGAYLLPAALAAVGVRLAWPGGSDVRAVRG